MTVPILHDEDVERLVSMREAVDAIEAAMARKGAQAFITPPRHYFRTKQGALTFTIGGDAEEGVAGFRVYGIFPGARGDDQFVAVYDASSGELGGLVFGSLVGELRTGAIGGVALKYCAREDARTLALIGSGAQARTQLQAAAAVRELSAVRVYSRSAANREAFVEEMRASLDLRIDPVASLEEAIAGADIVILATSSGSPVFDGALIEPGQHVTTIRMGATSHELDPAVADRAGAICTDSMEQLRSYPGGFFLIDCIDRITDLSGHVMDSRPVRSSPDEITLYCSTGLSGTEVVVADLALRKV